MSDISQPLASDLDRDQLIAKLRDLQRDFVRAGVKSMALFGSRARRDNRANSDIDLVIEVDEDRKFSLLDLIGIEHIVEDRIGFPTVILLRRSLTPDFEREVRRDGVEVF